MNYTFSDLVNVDDLKKTIEKLQSIIGGLPIAVIDPDGHILMDVGFQDICTQFHRKNPETEFRCKKSDAFINSRVNDGEYIAYKCQNGLIDMAAPIVIEGKHLVTLFIGQIFFEEPDLKYFENQAKEFGFDEESYLEALKKVPIVSEREAIQIMEYFAELAKLLTTVGLEKLKSIEAEKALRKSEIIYSILVDGITDAVALYEMRSPADLKLIRANSTFLSLFDLKKEHGLGKNVCSYDIANLWVEKSVQVIKNGKPSSYELVDNNTTYDVTIIPVPTETDHYIIIVLRDISEKKQLEEYRINVEKIESVGILAGGIAHDFNNILTIILGYLSMARSLSRKDEKIYTKLVEAEKASHQAKGLTKQLLTFAKGGAPVKQTVSIDAFIEETVAFALCGSNINFEYKLAGDLLPVSIDQDQISQALNNLILNAKQSMPEGGKITICTEKASATETLALSLPDDDYVKISIKDEGEGIPLEIRNQIFDPYFTTKSEGTGLGLASTYSIIKRHGGHIAVDSQVDIGATFTIYLPTTFDHLPKNIPSIPLKTGYGKVLVMDDEETIRNLAQEMLTLLGYDVELASNGFEAIELFIEATSANVPFDTIILDLTIRGSMGGKETIENILQIDPDVRAIVSSGYSDDKVLANHRCFGFKDMITKPYHLEELAEVLYRVIFESK